MVRQESLPLPARPASVPTGRHFLHGLLVHWHLTHLADTAALLASEALTNAVVHARTPLTLNVSFADLLTVDVFDEDCTPMQGPHASLGRQCPLKYPDLDAEGGRGLVLIAALSDCWGVDCTGKGKRVWFSLNPHPQA